MSEWTQILQFLLIQLRAVWNLVMSVWFLALPIFAVVVFNILRLVFSIKPSNENRKH